MKMESQALRMDSAGGPLQHLDSSLNNIINWNQPESSAFSIAWKRGDSDIGLLHSDIGLL